MILHFAPRSTGPQQQRELSDRFKAWTFSILDTIPAIALPVIFTDLNDGLGKCRGEHGEIYISDSEAIGIGAPSLEHYNGTTFRDIMADQYLHAPQTWTAREYTYSGTNDVQTEIDFIALPQGVSQKVLKADPLLLAVKQLQPIECSAPRDHAPVLLHLNYHIHFWVFSTR